MPFDTSMYENVGRVNLAGGLSEILNQQRQREAQREDRANRLADLAQSREMQGFQTRALQRAEAAIPQQEAELKRQKMQKHQQELNLEAANMARSGASPEEILQFGLGKTKEFGFDLPASQQFLTKALSGKTPEEIAYNFTRAAYPELAAKEEFQARYRKPEVEKPVVDNWQTVNTETGLVQINPRTGQTRHLGIKAPAKAAPQAQGGAKLSPTAQKELFEADDTAQSSKNVQGILQSALDLNDKTYSGYGAKARAVARSNLPGRSPEADNTILLDNMMTGQALESLKATFGGMPTEGERKILLEMQASADKTPAQRKDIIARAIEAAKKREKYASDRAKALRAGTYFSEQPAQTDAGEDQTWSDL